MPGEIDSLLSISLVPRAQQPPSFRLTNANTSSEDRTIGTVSEVAKPRRRIAPFSVQPQPLRQIATTVRFGRYDKGYRIQFMFDNAVDLQAFIDGSTLCRLSRAGFAGKYRERDADGPEERLFAIPIARLSAEETHCDNMGWTAEVHDRRVLEIVALARPGDFLAVDVAGIEVDFKTPVGSDPSVARESLSGGLILACRSEALEIARTDAEDQFLFLAEESLKAGDAAKALAVLRPSLRLQQVQRSDISEIWSGSVARLLPDGKDLASYSPFLMAIEQAWLATPNDARQRAASVEVLCLAASAATRTDFLAWLFESGDPPRSLSDLIFERFSETQCQGLKRTCHRTLVDILVRFAGSTFALVTATRLKGKLRLIERMNDPFIVDLAQIFGLPIDGKARAWVKVILAWDTSATEAFKAYGEIIGQPTGEPARDEDYDLLARKLDALDPIVSDCLAEDRLSLERGRTVPRPADQTAAAALQLIEEFKHALNTAKDALASRTAE
ncbi:MAG: hypothetical protein AAF950_16910 [Pseudomonadota bacterium]